MRERADSESLQVDLALMQRAAAGDRHARTIVARRVLDRGRRLARRLAVSESDAHDVLHEAVLQVLLSARSYRGDAPLEQWADRLFLRRAHQWRRSSARLTCVDEDLERLAVTEPPDGGLGDTLPRPLAEYLAELPETYRRALLLRYGLDHSVPEVAVSVGCSARRAKKRIFEGMAMLRMRIFRDVRRCQVPRDLARAEEVRPPC